MGHYKSNLRDIEFNLFEVFDTQRLLGTGPYEDMDLDTAREVLREVERVATGPFADSFVEGDRTPLQLADGEVTVPAGINRSLDAFFDGEWFRLQLPDHLGGFGAPSSLNWAATSMLVGANPSALLYTAGPFFAAILDELVTDEQRARWVIPMVENRWGSTMVLTEPDAGSDVGAGRTRATDAGDGTWHIEGTKRFITNGDFDWPDNIIHLVLARPTGHGPGTKGLSLFVVPKFWVNDDGSLGERNGVIVTGIEDKMGIKASATCELAFGDGGTPARGVLVGEVHDGIAQMFKVIEYARMLVGVKAIETLSTGYLNALEFARQRVQGPDLAQSSDKTAPRVEIIRHPDVRRNLMTQKAHVEGMRALVLYTASIQDQIKALEDAEDTASRSDQALTALRARNDFLLPLVKGYGSEKSYALLADALQVFGGSGYTRDYPMEQYIRDAKIDTLYEGTTGIQGMDLFFRKIARDQGAALSQLLADIKATAKGDAGNGALAEERHALLGAVEDVEGMLATMVEFFGRSVYLIGLTTTPLLFSLAELVIGWLMVRQAEVALATLSQEDHELTDADRAFYDGKVAATRWFVRTVLSQFGARRHILASTTTDVMELADTAF